MDSELSDDEMEALVETLHALQADLEIQLRTNSAAAAPVDLDQPFGRLSRMDAIQQQQMARAARAAQNVRLAQVKAALQRALRGEYGLCVSCEEEIETARLRARPESPLCLTCQRQTERRRR